jgi:hypothetical protein
MGSHSHCCSSYFVAALAVLSAVRFWILLCDYCTRVTKVLVDRQINFKIVIDFEDVQCKVCYKDVKYKTHTHTHTHTRVYIGLYCLIVKLVKL